MKKETTRLTRTYTTVSDLSHGTKRWVFYRRLHSRLQWSLRTRYLSRWIEVNGWKDYMQHIIRTCSMESTVKCI